MSVALLLVLSFPYEHGHLTAVAGLSTSAISEGNFSWPGGFVGGMVAGTKIG